MSYIRVSHIVFYCNRCYTIKNKPLEDLIMSEQFRQVRLASGLTVQQIANEAHVSRPVIERAEKGEAISMVYASRIVRALNELAGTSYTVEGLGIVASR
jgi:transcriptional regulator with XRE-family HTH domain